MVIPLEENQSNRKRHSNEIREKEKVRYTLLNDKLKWVVLYFLSAILRVPKKLDQRIDCKLFKMIDDLNWCVNYLWGIKTYQYLMTQV